MTKQETAQKTPAYRMVSVQESNPLLKQRDNIFYIGDNITLVANLAGSFRNGYATAVNLQQGVSFLRELLMDQYRFRGIMIDVPLHKLQLEKFMQFMQGAGLDQVPVLYVSTHLSQREVDEMISIHVVDDIVHPIRDIFTIGERMDFVGQVKREDAERRKQGRRRFSVMAALQTVLKRILDIILSSVLILIFAPVMLVIAILIRLDSSGPIFHNAYRAGKGYTIFKFYRFRTTKVGTARLVTSLSQINLFRDHGATFLKACDESSVTGIGQWLRRTCLNELPQLFNVWKGDMSMVGNRPLPLNEASQLTNDAFVERFNAPAGITGLWQIHVDGDSIRDRVQDDLMYAKQRTLWLDFTILCRTPAAWWRKVNAR
jgi:lipopolysaccharide/colanic/teichoic acid biosynthesis glycosyltransferase